MPNVGYSEEKIEDIMNDLRARILALRDEVEEMERRLSKG